MENRSKGSAKNEWNKVGYREGGKMKKIHIIKEGISHSQSREK